MNARARFIGHLERVREPLTAYVRGLLWERAVLPDALQSTFLTAFTKFSRFEEGTDFRAWIFRIATLTAFGLNRKAGAPRIEPEAVSAEVELEREYAYDEILRTPERILQGFEEDVRRGILALTEPERASLLLVVVGGFTCREAAEILEMPVGSMMGYLARARGKLRERLAEFARDRGFLGRSP